MCMSGRWAGFDLVDTKPESDQHPFRSSPPPAVTVGTPEHQTLPHKTKGKIQKLFGRKYNRREPISHSIRVSRNNRVVIETTGCMGKIRFSSNTRFPPQSDLSRLPGVYVVPGEFKAATDRPEELEAWERLRDRTRRLRTRLRKTRERRTSEECEYKTHSKLWRFHRSRSQ